jgi:hypothetical protein
VNRVRGRGRFAIALVVLIAACGNGGPRQGAGGPPTDSGGERSTPVEASPALLDLTEIERLKETFNADGGKPRLLLLLSPT